MDFNALFVTFAIDFIAPDIQQLHGGLNNYFLSLWVTSFSILLWFNFCRAVLSLRTAPIKLHSLLLQITFGYPLPAQNHLNVSINVSADKS